jgi:hypothetical protein
MILRIKILKLAVESRFNKLVLKECFYIFIIYFFPVIIDLAQVIWCLSMYNNNKKNIMK